MSNSAPRTTCALTKIGAAPRSTSLSMNTLVPGSKTCMNAMNTSKPAFGFTKPPPANTSLNPPSASSTILRSTSPLPPHGTPGTLGPPIPQPRPPPGLDLPAAQAAADSHQAASYPNLAEELRVAEEVAPLEVQVAAPLAVPAAARLALPAAANTPRALSLSRVPLAVLMSFSLPLTENSSDPPTPTLSELRSSPSQTASSQILTATCTALLLSTNPSRTLPALSDSPNVISISFGCQAPSLHTTILPSPTLLATEPVSPRSISALAPSLDAAASPPPWLTLAATPLAFLPPTPHLVLPQVPPEPVLQVTELPQAAPPVARALTKPHILQAPHPALHLLALPVAATEPTAAQLPRLLLPQHQPEEITRPTTRPTTLLRRRTRLSSAATSSADSSTKRINSTFRGWIWMGSSIE